MTASDPVGNIVDRYLPDASPEERREACERLDAYIRVIFRIAVRLYDAMEGDSPPEGGHDTISV